MTKVSRNMELSFTDGKICRKSSCGGQKQNWGSTLDFLSFRSLLDIPKGDVNRQLEDI